MGVRKSAVGLRLYEESELHRLQLRIYLQNNFLLFSLHLNFPRIFLFQNNDFTVCQHQSLEERIQAAKPLAEQIPEIPVYIDNIENTVSEAFGAYPERLYILHKEEIVHEGGMGPFFYNIKEINTWLQNFETRTVDMRNSKITGRQFV